MEIEPMFALLAHSNKMVKTFADMPLFHSSQQVKKWCCSQIKGADHEQVVCCGGQRR